MIAKLEQIATPARRRYLYRIAWVLLGLAGVYGLLDGNQLAAWHLVAAAILGVADGHTDPTTPTGMPNPVHRQHNVDTEEDTDKDAQ